MNDEERKKGDESVPQASQGPKIFGSLKGSDWLMMKFA